MESKIRGLLFILENKNNSKKTPLSEEPGSTRSKLGIQEFTKKTYQKNWRSFCCWLHAQLSGTRGTQMLAQQHRDADCVDTTDHVIKEIFLIITIITKYQNYTLLKSFKAWCFEIPLDWGFFVEKNEFFWKEYHKVWWVVFGAEKRYTAFLYKRVEEKVVKH